MRKTFRRIAFAAVALVAIADPSCRAALGHAFGSAAHEVAAEAGQYGPRTPSTGTEAAAPAGAGSAASYTIARRNADGTPIRWNPCAAIHVVVNTAGAPAGALDTVRAAVAKESAASGLRIVVDGTTTATPSGSYPTRRYAGESGWAPVLVAWGQPGTGPLGTDGASGVGEPAWVDAAGGRSVYVSGEIVLNSAQNQLMASGYGSSRELALLEHEFGHVLGLDHVADASQVMNPTVGAAADLGAGDLAGLHALGPAAGGCVTVPAPAWG